MLKKEWERGRNGEEEIFKKIPSREDLFRKAEPCPVPIAIGISGGRGG